MRQNATYPKAGPRGDFVPDTRSNCEKKVDGYDTRLKEECNCRRALDRLNFSVIPHSRRENIKPKMVLASSGSSARDEKICPQIDKF